MGSRSVRKERPQLSKCRALPCPKRFGNCLLEGGNEPMSATQERRERTYYFGCVGGPGHYMHRPDMSTDWSFCRNNPWGCGIDGGLLKGRKERYVLTQKDGWTALSFVDNTVDSRPGSNSSFLAGGNFTVEEMFAIAKRDFPAIASRCRLPTGETPMSDSSPTPVEIQPN